MEDLKVGDIVILKSDNGMHPIKMTISVLYPADIECIWKDGNNFQKMRFPIGTLKKTE
jgi:hypothetical protein